MAPPQPLPGAVSSADPRIRLDLSLVGAATSQGEAAQSQGPVDLRRVQGPGFPRGCASSVLPCVLQRALAVWVSSISVGASCVCKECLCWVFLMCTYTCACAQPMHRVAGLPLPPMLPPQVPWPLLWRACSYPRAFCIGIQDLATLFPAC